MHSFRHWYGVGILHICVVSERACLCCVCIVLAFWWCLHVCVEDGLMFTCCDCWGCAGVYMFVL